MQLKFSLACHFLVIAVCSYASIAQSQRQTTVFLVRHGEKESSQPDAPLSSRGHERSECLSKLLRDANIRTIYVSEFVRARQTAEPLATKLGISSTQIPAADTDTLVSRLRHQSVGNILVVGHSDTIPIIVDRLTGTAVRIEESEYDKLYLVAPDQNGVPPITLRYCQCR